MNKSATTRYFEDIDTIPHDYELEYAYNFLKTFHTLKPEFVKGTCWEELHKKAAEYYFNFNSSTYNYKIDGLPYMGWLAKEICRISNEKDFVGLYKKYTDRVE